MSNQVIPDFIQNLGSELDQEKTGVYNTNTQLIQVPDFIQDLPEEKTTTKTNYTQQIANNNTTSSGRTSLSDIMNQHKQSVQTLTNNLNNSKSMFRDKEVSDILDVQLDQNLTDEQKQEYVDSLSDEQRSNWNKLKKEGYSFEARKALTENESDLWDITQPGLNKYIQYNEASKDALRDNSTDLSNYLLYESLSKGQNYLKNKVDDWWEENVIGSLDDYYNTISEPAGDYAYPGQAIIDIAAKGVTDTLKLAASGAQKVMNAGDYLNDKILDIIFSKKLEGTSYEDYVGQDTDTLLGSTLDAADGLIDLAWSIASPGESTIWNTLGETPVIGDVLSVIPMIADAVVNETPVGDFLDKYGNERSRENLVNLLSIGLMRAIGKVGGKTFRYLRGTKNYLRVKNEFSKYIRAGKAATKEAIHGGENAMPITAAAKSMQRQESQFQKSMENREKIQATIKSQKEASDLKKDIEKSKEEPKTDETKTPVKDEELNLDNPSEDIQAPIFDVKKIRESFKKSKVADVTSKIKEKQSDKKIGEQLGVDEETIETIKDNPETWDLLTDMLKGAKETKAEKGTDTNLLQTPVENLVEGVRDRLTFSKAKAKANKKVKKNKTAEDYYQEDTVKRNLNELSQMISGNKDPIKVLELLSKMSDKTQNRFEEIYPGFKNQVKALQVFNKIVEGVETPKEDTITRMIDLLTPRKKAWNLKNYAIRKMMNWFKETYMKGQERDIPVEEFESWLESLPQEDLNGIVAYTSMMDALGYWSSNNKTTQRLFNYTREKEVFPGISSATEPKNVTESLPKDLENTKNFAGKTFNDLNKVYGTETYQTLSTIIQNSLTAYYNSLSDQIVFSDKTQGKGIGFHEQAHQIMSKMGIGKMYKFIMKIQDMFPEMFEGSELSADGRSKGINISEVGEEGANAVKFRKAGEIFAEMMRSYMLYRSPFGKRSRGVKFEKEVDLRLNDLENAITQGKEYKSTTEKGDLDLRTKKLYTEFRKTFGKTLDSTNEQLSNVLGLGEEALGEGKYNKENYKFLQEFADLAENYGRGTEKGQKALEGNAQAYVNTERLGYELESAINEVDPDVRGSYWENGRFYLEINDKPVDAMDYLKDLKESDPEAYEQVMNAGKYLTEEQQEIRQGNIEAARKEEIGAMEQEKKGRDVYLGKDQNKMGAYEHMDDPEFMKKMVKEQDYDVFKEQFGEKDAKLLKNLYAYRDNGELYVKKPYWRTAVRLEESRESMEYLREKGASEELLNTIESQTKNVSTQLKEDYDVYKRLGMASPELEELMNNLKENNIDLDWYFNN